MRFWGKFIKKDYKKSSPGYPRKIYLKDSLKMFYGKHRSGWLYVLKSIESLHHRKGVYFDSFIERTFNWSPDGVKPHRNTWVGVIHVPPNIPQWFGEEQSNNKIFETEAWQVSLPFCRGLFTMCEYHKKNLENKLSIPINSLIHPTEFPDLTWSWDRFQANKEKKVVQIGWWLRKLHTIFQLPVRTYKKVFIKITYADVNSIMAKEREILKKEGVFTDDMYETASVISFLPNEEYDRLLSENIVVANLYDSSANNLLIECIVRNTPILINPLESILEYLGEDYPLYFNSVEEAAEKAENVELIYEAYKYLLNHPIKEKLTGEYFRESFANSAIYRSL
jgi:hypothetical protein